MTGKQIGGYNGINNDEYGQLNFLHSKYIAKQEPDINAQNLSGGNGNNLTSEQIIDIAKNQRIAYVSQHYTKVIGNSFILHSQKQI